MDENENYTITSKIGEEYDEEEEEGGIRIENTSHSSSSSSSSKHKTDKYDQDKSQSDEIDRMNAIYDDCDEEIETIDVHANGDRYEDDSNEYDD